jgi:hypothetical protein
MASGRCTDMPARPMAFLDCTRVTLDAFPHLVLPSRRHSTPLWPHGVSTGSPGPPASCACRRGLLGIEAYVRSDISTHPEHTPPAPGAMGR